MRLIVDVVSMSMKLSPSGMVVASVQLAVAKKLEAPREAPGACVKLHRLGGHGPLNHGYAPKAAVAGRRATGSRCGTRKSRRVALPSQVQSH